MSSQGGCARGGGSVGTTSMSATASCSSSASTSIISPAGSVAGCDGVPGAAEATNSVIPRSKASA
eukprot:3944883-Heterocapsa_arctica.AAC.1